MERRSCLLTNARAQTYSYFLVDTCVWHSGEKVLAHVLPLRDILGGSEVGSVLCSVGSLQVTQMCSLQISKHLEGLSAILYSR